jgi:hypothetical protein
MMVRAVTAVADISQLENKRGWKTKEAVDRDGLFSFD